jgi:AcrR family transcriptional regulator
MRSRSNEDRRTRKTKKALREALVHLLHEKSIQSITVRELTDKADIHRSTFYANFKDVYELYDHMEATMIQEICDILSDDYAFKSDEFFAKLLAYVNNHRDISRLFFGGNISTSLYERLTSLFKNSFIECWNAEYNCISEDMDYYVQYCLSGSLGAIGLWVSKGFEHPEKLVIMLSEIEAGVGNIIRKK